MMLILIAAMFLTISIWQLNRFVLALRPNTLINRITLREPEISSGHSLLAGIVQRLKFQNSKHLQRALFELPDIMELLAVALASGESVYNSISKVISRADGLVAKEFSYLLRAVQLGSSFEEELEEIADRLPQQHVIEFVNKLALAMRRGTPLAKLLHDQSQSVRHEIQNEISKQAGKNETRMMIPLVFLILPVTVLFAIYPSLQLLNIQSM